MDSKYPVRLWHRTKRLVQVLLLVFYENPLLGPHFIIREPHTGMVTLCFAKETDPDSQEIPCL
jgi:hypothetical protein